MQWTIYGFLVKELKDTKMFHRTGSNLHTQVRNYVVNLRNETIFLAHEELLKLTLLLTKETVKRLSEY